MTAVGTRSYTPRPLGDEYGLFADLCMRSPGWVLWYDADEDHTLLYHANHGDLGVYLAAADLGLLAALMRAAAEHSVKAAEGGAR